MEHNSLRQEHNRCASVHTPRMGMHTAYVRIEVLDLHDQVVGNPEQVETVVIVVHVKL